MRSRISLEQIMETSRRLFRANGYENTSLDTIAAELGVTRAALYYWVRSKESLLCEIHEAILDVFIARFEEIRSQHDDEIVILSETLRMHALTAIENIEAVTSFFQDQRSLPEPNAQRIAKKKAGYDHAIEDLLRSAQAKGTVRADLDARLMARSLVGMGNWLTQWYNPTRGLPPSAVADQLVAISLHGIVTPASAPAAAEDPA